MEQFPLRYARCKKVVVFLSGSEINYDNDCCGSFRP